MAEISGESSQSPASLLSDLERLSKESAKYKDFQKNVFQELECPVCLEIPVPPVTVCKNGHFICGTCRKKVEKCVICRGDYTNTRNFAIEKIVLKSELKCKNKACEEFVGVEKLDEHLKICEYRPIVCNLNNGTVCKDKLINFEQYIEHLLKSHLAGAGTPITSIFKFGVSSSSRTFINEQRSVPLAWPKFVFQQAGGIFILNMQIESAIAFFWVTSMLNKAKVKDVVAHLQIGQCQKDSERSSRTWTIGILPVQMTLSEIKGTENRVAFPAKRLIRLSGTNAAGDGPFSFDVQLKLQRRVQVHGRPPVPFKAVTGTDIILENGKSVKIYTSHQCITAMKEYAHKSLEEVRFEDYQSGRTGKPYTDLLFLGTQAQLLTAASLTPKVMTQQPSTSASSSGGSVGGVQRPRIASQSFWTCGGRCTLT